MNIPVPSGKLRAYVNSAETNCQITASDVAYAGGYKSVKFAVWSEVNGQDDLRWYTASPNADGNWLANVSISNHKTAGRYQAHMYVVLPDGTQTIVNATTFSATEPKLTSLVSENIDASKGTFTVVGKGISPLNGIEKVEIAVWSQKDQRDLKWYTLGDVGNGEYRYTVDIKNHNYNYGQYHVHAYVTGKSGIRKCVNSTTVTLPVPSGKLQAVLNSAESACQIMGSGIAYAGGYKGIKFAVWSEANGQDDLRWYSAVKNSRGEWICTVPISNHKTAGRYQVHMYLVRPDGSEKILNATTFTVKGPDLASLYGTNVNASNGTFSVIGTGTSPSGGIEKIEVAVWSQEDHGDLKWYSLTGDSNGIYRCTVDIANHKFNYGNYHVHAYVTAKNGVRKCVNAATVSIARPSCSLTAELNTDETQCTLTAGNVTYAGGVKGVKIAVWSEANGQDDLRWYTATRDKSGNWKVTVPLNNHMTAGKYQAHLYAVVGSEEDKFLNGKTFSVSTPKVEITGAFRQSGSVYETRIKPSGYASYYKEIKMRTWSVDGGQDDATWYIAGKKGNEWVAGVLLKKHKGTGMYLSYVYGVHFTGRMDLLSIDSFVVEDSKKVAEWQPEVAKKTIKVAGIKRQYDFLFIADAHMSYTDTSDDMAVQQLDRQRRGGFVNSKGLRSYEQFPKFIAYANAHNVDAFLMGGDIIDVPSANNIAMLQENLQQLKCQYLYVPGNHDWTYPWEYMTQKGEKEYRPLLQRFCSRSRCNPCFIRDSSKRKTRHHYDACSTGIRVANKEIDSEMGKFNCNR